MNYYNQNMINQLMKQKDNIDNMINQYSQQQPPVQNIINTMPLTEFEARILRDNEDVSSVFVNKKTMLLDKKNKKLYVKEINGNISEQYDIIVPLDEKDKKIQALENEVKSLREMIINDTKSNNTNANGTNAAKKPTNVQNNATNVK